MFTKNPFNKKDEVADLIGNILEADYKVKKEELKGNQHKIDMNKNNKIDAHDFKLLRSKGGTQKDEEIDPNKVTTDTLKGRAMGKDANPFLSKKVFMDVPDNVKEETKGVTEGSEQEKPIKKSDWFNPTDMRSPAQQKAAYLNHLAAKKRNKNIGKEQGVAEEVEQIDEIGDTPAGKRALRAVQNRAADTMSDPSKSSKQVNKAVGAGVSAGNRLHGFGHDRMKKNTVMGRDALRKQLGVKEEVEQIDERELTKGETKEKERIVKGMKKSLSGFKQSYGDRAKSVMYATATKAAKKG